MTESYVAISHQKREIPHRLNLDRGFRDAVSDHMRHRWPSGTAKHAAKTYDLTLDRARDAVAGRCSLTTLEQIVKRGGWPVGLSILAAVIGYGVEQYISEQRVIHEERWGRFTALFGDGRGNDPVRDGGSVRMDRGVSDRRVSSRR